MGRKKVPKKKIQKRRKKEKKKKASKIKNYRGDNVNKEIFVVAAPLPKLTIAQKAFIDGSDMTRIIKNNYNELLVPPSPPPPPPSTQRAKELQKMREIRDNYGLKFAGEHAMAIKDDNDASRVPTSLYTFGEYEEKKRREDANRAKMVKLLNKATGSTMKAGKRKSRRRRKKSRRRRKTKRKSRRRRK